MVKGGKPGRHFPLSRNDANIYKVQYGSKVIHLVDVVHALAGDYNEDNVLKYFDLVDNASIRGQSGWCNFKPGTKLSDLPEALHPLWRKRKQYFFIDLMNEGFKPVVNVKYDDNTYVEIQFILINGNSGGRKLQSR